MIRQSRVVLAACLAAAAFAAAPASAQTNTRSFVSRAGNNTNPCTPGAPCATFAGAIAKTSASGVINCLDPGEYGAATIDKAITINCEAARASVTVSNPGGSGFLLTTSGFDIVNISGVDFQGLSESAYGISVEDVALRELHVRDVSIAGFNEGIHFWPNNVSQLQVKDSTVANNNFAGVHVSPFAPGAVNAHLSRVRIENNGIGLYGNGAGSNVGININVQDGFSTGNNNSGVYARSNNGDAPVNITIISTQVSGNFGSGLKAEQAGSGFAFIRVGASMISANALGIATTGAGQVHSFGNNQVIVNGGGQNFTGTDFLK